MKLDSGLCLLNAVFLLDDVLEGKFKTGAQGTAFFYLILGAFLFGLTVTQGFESLFGPATPPPAGGTCM